MNNQELNQKWQAYVNKPSKWHNQFHLEMPFGLINDPNGLCYQDGKYHIFYQWNPVDCTHAHKHWGYTQTADFINYTKPQIALAPVDDFDKNGCYSGSARPKNKRMEIFYTANLKDKHNIRYPRQILAVKNDDGSFTKEKIIIDTVPEGYTTHFRDPYLFTHSNRSFMVLGAQRQNETGCCLIYEEIEGQWIFRGELQTQYKDFGYMWECPNFITIDNHDILLFCPQGLKPQGINYRNIYQSGYLIGKFDPDTLNFTHGEFCELDKGFDFYAPQVLKRDDRHILIGWIGMPDKLADYPTASEGWVHSLTMPRELSIKQGKLYQKPIDELNALCLDKQQFNLAAEGVLALTKPCKLALAIDLTAKHTWQAKLHFGEEFITLTYDKQTQIFTIDRTHLNLGGKEIREFKVIATDKLSLEIFLDTSIMEIYCQKGEACATVCYFVENTNATLNVNISTTIIKYNLTNFKYN